MENLKTSDSKVYPMLTMALLEGLEKKVRRRKTTGADCELLDHYLTSIGFDGFLPKALMKCGVIRFEDVTAALVSNPRDLDTTPIEITFSILACIQGLMDYVIAGEKIY